MAEDESSAMSQEQARVLFEQGATLVFLDVPERTEFGIDYNSWEVGPKFRGVKMIPPGIHFIFYSAVNREGNVAPRTGFFYNFKQKEILVKRWDKRNEDIIVEIVTAEELERFESNKKDLDRFLGAYPYENYKKWVSLTNLITTQLLEKLQPLTGKISSVSEFLSEKSNTADRKAAASGQTNTEGQMETDDDKTIADDIHEAGSSLKEKQHKIKSLQELEASLPDMKSKPGTEIRFSKIPKRKFPVGATSSEITKYSMDHSYALDTMLSHYTNSEDFLGEIQFSFTCFILGQVYDAFEQWKLLVNLLCSCSEGLTTHKDIYSQFITVLHFQLKEIPKDFFVDIVSQNNFLTLTLQSFFANLESSDTDENLRKRGLKFRDYLTKTFKWDFISELDEYAPVIVETDP